MTLRPVLAALTVLSACSNEDTAEPPAAPAEVRALAGNGFIRVLWQDRSANEDGFVVLRETVTPEPSQREEIAQVGRNRTEFDDTGVVQGSTYRYAVAARAGTERSEVVAQTGPAVGPLEGASADCVVSQVSVDDQDGDGVRDDNEISGWTVTVVDGRGEASSRTVTSDPTRGDTDADGLCDREERQSATDPNQADTDADGLDDQEELRTWGSDPSDVDSDDDSRGNAALYDGNELQMHGTSPTLEDTDGDGISDYVEIIERGVEFDPLVANTPLLELDFVGETDVRVNIAFSDSNQEATQEEVQLEREQSSSFSTTDSRTHETWAEVGVEVSSQASASFPTGASVSSEVTASASAGYSYSQTRSVTRESSQRSRQAYSRGLSTSREQGREIADGTVGVGFRITNTGAVSFDLSDLTVTALLRDRTDPTSFRAIATLDFGEAIPEAITLGPEGETGTLRGEVTVPANLALDLLANPQGLFFEIATFELTDEEGRDFQFLRETTNAQTGHMVINFGDGFVLNRRVATNVQRNNGAIVGARMETVMADALGLTYRTQTPGDGGPAVLTSVTKPDGTEVAATGSGFWAVVGQDGTVLDASTAFDDIVLRAGGSILLFYVEDQDGDGLYAHEEYLFGTSDEDPDTDGDELTDFEETKVGWTVDAMVAPYPARVFSNPNQADADMDGSTDAQERAARTDPDNPDTDGDGACDGPGTGPSDARCRQPDDWDPLDPRIVPVRPDVSFLFTNFDLNSETQNARLEYDGDCELEELFGPDRFDAPNSALDVSAATDCGGAGRPRFYGAGSGGFEASISFWLRVDDMAVPTWFLMGGFEPTALHIVSSEPTSGAHRLVFLEDERVLLEDPTERPAGEWAHYLLSFGDRMVLYRNGVEVASEPRQVDRLFDEFFLFVDDFRQRVASFGTDGRGRFDDFQFYDDALDADTARILYERQR